MENLRSGISDVVNSLNKLRNNIGDPEQQNEIQKVLRIHFMLWEEVIRQEIKSTTPQYKAALNSLVEAEKAAEDAIEDAEKVATAIKKAVKAAKAVDKVVKVISEVMV